MSAIAESPVRPPAAEVDAERLKYRLAVAAISEYSGNALAGLDVPDALRLLAARGCAVLDIARCSVFVAAPQREEYLGCAAYPRDEIEPAVMRLKLGGPSDRLTREIVASGAPLLIRDAHTDPLALTGAIRAWKLRSLLGVPMLSGERTVGLMMFDNGDRLHPYAPVDLEVALVFAALAASVVERAHHHSALERRVDTVIRQNKLLRRTAVAEHRLSDCILRGAGLAPFVELAARLSGKPAALYDAAGQRTAMYVPEHATAEPGATLMADALADSSTAPRLQDAVPGASVMIEPLSGATHPHRHLATAVNVGGDRWGWLVLMEQPARFTSFDEFLARRAATYLTLELAGRRRQAASSADARALLARQLIGGTTSEEELARNAECVGVRLDAHRVVVYVKSQSRPIDVDAWCDALRARVDTDMLATSEQEGGALLVDVPKADAACIAVRAIKGALIEALADIEDGAAPAEYSVGVSGLCRSVAGIAGGYREARQVVGCIDNVPGGTARRVLTADDLGPGRLFVANGNPDELARFTEDVLGPLLQTSDACVELLRTLEAFYDSGRSVRLASERLGVHENTVRYRMSRVHSLTGLDVAADADDQLSVQVALLVLRLQGHPGICGGRTDDPGANAPAGRATVADAQAWR